MSENENPPSKQTSSVPLKKETVRVTLKAADAPAASPTGAPPAPAAPKPTVAAPTPTAPKPPTPSVPAATRPPAPAPTIPLKTAAGSAPAPAPTIRLNTAPAAAPAAGGAPSPGPTVALPKATVQLNPPTQPLGSQAPAASQMATMQMEGEDEAPSPLINALAIIGFVGAAAVIAIQLMTSNVWLKVDDQGKSTDAEWGRLF